MRECRRRRSSTIKRRGCGCSCRGRRRVGECTCWGRRRRTSQGRLGSKGRGFLVVHRRRRRCRCCCYQLELLLFADLLGSRLFLIRRYKYGSNNKMSQRSTAEEVGQVEYRTAMPQPLLLYLNLSLSQDQIRPDQVPWTDVSWLVSSFSLSNRMCCVCFPFRLRCQSVLLVDVLLLPITEKSWSLTSSLHRTQPTQSVSLRKAGLCVIQPRADTRAGQFREI